MKRKFNVNNNHILFAFPNSSTGGNYALNGCDPQEKCNVSSVIMEFIKLALEFGNQKLFDAKKLNMKAIFVQNLED